MDRRARIEEAEETREAKVMSMSPGTHRGDGRSGGGTNHPKRVVKGREP
jgi:hypothetical protein